MTEIFQWFNPFFDNWLLLVASFLILGFVNSFLPPVPIEGFTVLGGYLAGTGHGSAVLVWLSSSFGMIMGSIFLFNIVRLNKEWLLKWRLIKKHLTPEYMNKSHDWFEHYGVWAIFTSKIIPWMTFAMLFYAGLTKMSLYRMLPFISLSNLIYFGVLVLIGHYAKEEWQIIFELIKPILSWAGLIVIIIGICCFLIWRLKRQKN